MASDNAEPKKDDVITINIPQLSTTILRDICGVHDLDVMLSIPLGKEEIQGRNVYEKMIYFQNEQVQAETFAEKLESFGTRLKVFGGLSFAVAAGALVGSKRPFGTICRYTVCSTTAFGCGTVAMYAGLGIDERWRWFRRYASICSVLAYDMKIMNAKTSSYREYTLPSEFISKQNRALLQLGSKESMMFRYPFSFLNTWTRY